MQDQEPADPALSAVRFDRGVCVLRPPLVWSDAERAAPANQISRDRQSALSVEENRGVVLQAEFEDVRLQAFRERLLVAETLHLEVGADRDRERPQFLVDVAEGQRPDRRARAHPEKQQEERGENRARERDPRARLLWPGQDHVRRYPTPRTVSIRDDDPRASSFFRRRAINTSIVLLIGSSRSPQACSRMSSRDRTLPAIPELLQDHVFGAWREDLPEKFRQTLLDIIGPHLHKDGGHRSQNGKER